jgi:hypothetical protein
MFYRRSLQFLSLLFLFFLVWILTSCEKFSGDQTIPAYLKIDSIGFTTDYSTQGSSSHSITDAWVYVDDNLVGAFSLPATFPVLHQGTHTVKILPGIKRNGIAATRISYQFYKPVEKKINFVPDSTVTAGPVSSSYTAVTNFLWQEDFENDLVTLDTTNRSSLALGKSVPGTAETFERQYSGKVVMDSLDQFFECETHEDYLIPNAAVFLEMDFNISNEVTVGVAVVSGLIITYSDVLYLIETGGKWKKIYIDLTTSLNSVTGGTSFKVYIKCAKKDADGIQKTLLFDNLKLVSVTGAKL